MSTSDTPAKLQWMVEDHDRRLDRQQMQIDKVEDKQDDFGILTERVANLTAQVANLKDQVRNWTIALWAVVAGLVSVALTIAASRYG